MISFSRAMLCSARYCHSTALPILWLSVFGAMQIIIIIIINVIYMAQIRRMQQMAQCNAMTKRNPAKRVQNKRALLAYYFIQSAVAEWKSK